MQFNLNIPDSKVDSIFNAFAEKFNYQEEIDNPDVEIGGKIPNTETIDMFCKRMIIGHIKLITKEHLIQQARYQAEAVISNQIDQVDII